VPATELTRLLGCRHEWQPARGGWIPCRSADLETSVPGVLVAGDGAGIGGMEAAILEGRLAGLVAAERLGRPPGAARRDAGERLRRRLRRLGRFRAGIEAMHRPPADFLALLTPDTVVCRCEEITAGQLGEALERGIESMDAVKATTRVTMGRCQGRNCARTLADLVARARGCSPADLPYPRPRPPARPVRIGDLLGEDLPPAVFPEVTLP
jgi:bacterioferritin-associated ferredoxin